VTDRWPLPIRLIHWTTVALILIMVPAIYAARALTETDTDRAEGLASLHVGCGLAVLVLTAARIAARVTFPRPAPLPTALALRLVASAVQVSLYGLLVAMPLTGILKLTLSGLDVSVFGVTIIESGERLPMVARDLHVAHAVLGKLLIGLAIAHAGFALLHGRLAGTRIMRRMV
jgi:cytochrome b561